MSTKPANAKQDFKSESLTQGLVAFFDILGYKSLVKNNGTEYCVRLTKAALYTVPIKLKKLMRKYHGQYLPNQFAFADSLLVYTAFPPVSDPPVEHLFPVSPFLAYCRNLMDVFFRAGLPLRGGIAFGDFYADRNLITGKAVIEAHELGESLQLAGCALTSKAEQFVLDPTGLLKETSIPSPFADDLVEYDTPIKPKPVVSSKKLRLLKFWKEKEGKLRPTHDLVRKQFAKHNKKIDDASVLEKIENTFRFLERCSNRPQAS